ncbi:hypothetical protein [Fervidibacillus halotolerans]|uniref:Uncharacterized protein n=1 Tax=Fervidibacillus halotolerans TaxID=2980027 RepID=A0A9E8RZC0_9BACI|nr:hypothetical protein [Fervidibacillus halotolerans]WAA13173.1 hypothetical protein OE105_03320 [Fervidibacillus halotolerans]
MKKGLLWIGIIGIIISNIGNYLYYQSQQLEHPIFLKHFYSHSFYQNDEYSFPFFYLTNKANPKKIKYIVADNVAAYPNNQTTQDLVSNTSDIHPVDEYNHQYLLSDYISFSYDSIPFDEDGTWSFQEISVYFTDGDYITTDIGKVVFKDKMENDNSEAIDFTISESNSDGLGKFKGYTTESLQIEKIETLLDEKLKNDIDLRINGQKVSLSNNEEIGSANLKEDDLIEIQWKIDSLSNAFEVELYLIGTTETGKPFVTPTFVSSQPTIDQKKVNELIKEGDKQ